MFQHLSIVKKEVGLFNYGSTQFVPIWAFMMSLLLAFAVGQIIIILLQSLGQVNKVYNYSMSLQNNLDKKYNIVEPDQDKFPMQYNFTYRPEDSSY